MNLQVFGSRKTFVALAARVGALVRVCTNMHKHFVPGDKINLDYSFCLRTPNISRHLLSGRSLSVLIFSLPKKSLIWAHLTNFGYIGSLLAGMLVDVYRSRFFIYF